MLFTKTRSTWSRFFGERSSTREKRFPPALADEIPQSGNEYYLHFSLLLSVVIPCAEFSFFYGNQGHFPPPRWRGICFGFSLRIWRGIRTRGRIISTILDDNDGKGRAGRRGTSGSGFLSFAALLFVCQKLWTGQRRTMKGLWDSFPSSLPTRDAATER